MKSDECKSEEWPVVMLRHVDDIDVALWEDAWRIDPEAFSWVRMESQSVPKNGLVDVTVRVSPHRFADATEGLRGRRNIADAVRWAIDEIAREVNEDDYIRGEVQSLPLCADQSVMRTHGLVLEWSLSDTYGVMGAIAMSRREVSGVVLLRRGSVGKKTVPLVVFLPPALFDTAWRKRLQRESATTVAQCALNAIYESYEAEPRPSIRFDPDEIPF